MTGYKPFTVPHARGHGFFTRFYCHNHGHAHRSAEAARRCDERTDRWVAKNVRGAIR